MHPRHAERFMAKILVVDDQEMMRDSLAATLTREGHEVVACGDGAAAVARLAGGQSGGRPGRVEPPLTDLKMPRTTGIELRGQARRPRPEGSGPAGTALG